jgi:hypothetical protein
MTDMSALSLSIYADGYRVDTIYVFEYNDTDDPQHPASVGIQRVFNTIVPKLPFAIGADRTGADNFQLQLLRS